MKKKIEDLKLNLQKLRLQKVAETPKSRFINEYHQDLKSNLEENVKVLSTDNEKSPANPFTTP